MPHRYTLDPTSNKFLCPKCDKKTFVKYWDIENLCYLNNDVGKCDRLANCGHHYKPRNYFLDHQLPVITKTSNNYVQPPVRPKDFLDINWISTYSNNFRTNHFVQFLCLLFDKLVVKKIITDYLLCTISTPWRDSVIFWEIDQFQRLCYGKIMDYDARTGRRIKKPYARVHSFHKVYFKGHKSDFNYQRCLFGLHRINEDLHKPLAITESEKTACIMSAVDDNFLWLACGSIGNINSKMFAPIKHRKIVLYPDLSEINTNGQTAHDIWQEKASKLVIDGYEISISNFLYTIANQDEKKVGYDIADFYIENFLKTPYKKAASCAVRLLTKKELDIQKITAKNPIIKVLIDTFNLE